MSIYPEIDSMSFDALIERWDSLLLEESEESDLYFESIVRGICSSGNEGIEFIINFIEQNYQDNFQVNRLNAALIVFSLYMKEINSQSLHVLNPILLYLLDGTDSSLLQTAIEIFAMQRYVGIKQKILDKISHSSPHVRGSVLRYMSDVFPSESIALLFTALQDDSYIIRETAIDALDEMDSEYQPANLESLFTPFLSDPHPDVRQAAETAIENLRLYPD
jgi:hypothetical protein